MLSHGWATIWLNDRSEFVWEEIFSWEKQEPARAVCLREVRLVGSCLASTSSKSTQQLGILWYNFCYWFLLYRGCKNLHGLGQVVSESISDLWSQVAPLVSRAEITDGENAGHVYCATGWQLPVADNMAVSCSDTPSKIDCSGMVLP